MILPLADFIVEVHRFLFYWLYGAWLILGLLLFADCCRMGALRVVIREFVVKRLLFELDCLLRR